MSKVQLKTSYRLPARPTQAWPGSAAKIEVMRRRIARGESCFHPDDLAYRPRASDQTGALDRMLRQSGVELVDRRHLQS